MYIEENITEGVFISKTSEVVTTEPVTLAEVKAYIGIDFVAHDTKLTSLIKACRIELENLKSITLIDSRTVTVVWKKLHDWAELPYCPISGTITSTDLDNVVITDVKVHGVGNFKRVYGNYPDGLKLNYGCVKLSIDDNIKSGLIKAVKECFETNIPAYKAVLNEFKYATIS